jgi:hypothetical protein
MWPFTSWGEGSSLNNTAFPTWSEYEACMRDDVPDLAHVIIRGNWITGYRAEIVGQGE